MLYLLQIIKVHIIERMGSTVTMNSGKYLFSQNKVTRSTFGGMSIQLMNEIWKLYIALMFAILFTLYMYPC